MLCVTGCLTSGVHSSQISLQIVAYVRYERAFCGAHRKTNHVERFNNTLRQRISRLVRDTLSSSKKLANHIGAIKFCICHYNLVKAAALPVEHYPIN
jgi:hypothetical protein